MKSYPKNRLFFVTLTCVACAMGCSTTQGPVIAKHEVSQATKEMQVKALRFDLERMKKVNQLGYELVRQIPEEDVKTKPRPFLGLYVVPRNKVTNRYFDQRPDKGVYIGFVLDDTPLANSGVRGGDVLVAINDEEIDGIKTVLKTIKKIIKKKELEIGETVQLHMRRMDEEFTTSVEIKELPIDVSFSIRSDQTVNAFATTNHIYVNQGLLGFTKDTDNQLASVIAHELGHIARGHLKRYQRGQVATSIIAFGLGVTADVFAPGTGSLVQLGAGSMAGLMSLKFSRDLEREADYYGAKFLHMTGYDPMGMVEFQERISIEVPSSLSANYLHTHPSSPERKVRVEQTIEALDKGLAPSL